MGSNLIPILADSVVDIPHVAAFDLLWSQRLSAIEIDQLLVYVIDTVTAEALPYLADQFDVAGEKGYRLANTDAQRRAIIKQAIELKRYLGTVWAVREAMKSIGFGDADLIEGVDEGTPAIDWAKFRVVADLGNERGIPDPSDASELTALINYYKNVRSLLLDISYKCTITDTLPPINDDNLNFKYITPLLDEDLGWIARFADGTYLADGSINANEGNDYMTVNII